MLELTQAYGVGIIETPMDSSWLADPNNCDGGISTAEVYFAPTFASDGATAATCTMSAEQSLYLSPVLVICTDGVEGESADVACLDGLWNPTDSSVTVDGVEMIGGLDERIYETEVFEATLPEENVFDAAGGPTRGIIRGQAVVVEGLEAGEHEVVVSGDFGNGEFAGALTIDLTVEG